MRGTGRLFRDIMISLEQLESEFKETQELPMVALFIVVNTPFLVVPARESGIAHTLYLLGSPDLRDERMWIEKERLLPQQMRAH